MREVSLRFLVGSLVALLAAAGPLAAEEPTLLGTWALDMKASRNVPEAQKGVDLRISVKDDQLMLARYLGEVAVGEPLAVVLDGKSHTQKIGGQNATVVAKWLKLGAKFEQVVSMPQPGSVLVAVQTIVTEVSPTGTTMTRSYTTRLAKEREERLLVYRRK